jgi:hypothetical protein
MAQRWAKKLMLSAAALAQDFIWNAEREGQQ